MAEPQAENMAGSDLPLALLTRILGGVANATKASPDTIQQVKDWIETIAAKDDLSRQFTESTNSSAASGLELIHWALTKWPQGSDANILAGLTIAVADLREHSRHEIPISETKLSLLWDTVYQALNNDALQETWVPSRSAQGFLSVPLCSILTEDKKIDELIRFHVWMPDGKRGNTDLAVHSHQPWAQSWILAGEGLDLQYEGHRVTNRANATHEEFGLTWNTGTSSGKQYSAHQVSSQVARNGNLVRVRLAKAETHRRNDTYSVPAAAFHSSKVAPDVLHATFFYFDSSRGFIQDAPVLGPIGGEPYAQVRDPAGETPKSLAKFVYLIRAWEQHMEEGQKHARKAEWEEALRALNSALNLCETAEGFPNAKRYRGIVLGELGCTNRRFGRYTVAESLLKEACQELSESPEQATFNGELGVVYRHMDRLEEAKEAFQSQYETAKKLGLLSEACRAIGNAGMVSYQLSQQSGDEGLLQLAIEQLQERVTRCEEIRSSLGEVGSSSYSAQKTSQIEIWTTVGLARLAMCYTVKGDAEEAFTATEQALEHAQKSGDPTVVAISRFFYGRAYALKGEHDKALEQFNAQDACTPAIAFCKEPSEEHRGYLEYLVEAGADMDLVDHQGYKALDYAVFNGDEASKDIVLKGLRKQFSGEADLEAMLQQRETEARLRKGYRELFQEKLRPVLLAGGDDCIEKLRIAYAEALSSDKARGETFDYFKVVPYTEFLRHGKMPRSSDGLTRKFVHATDNDTGKAKKKFVIFFSYRWLNPMAGPGGGTPDDEDQTQYRRMKKAVEEFLESHKDIDPENLQVWMDYSCVDQDDPTKGVVALPMILAQCDAVISLIDNQYYDRAWCSVEVMMIKTLKESYNVHIWYEQPIETNEEKKEIQTPGKLRGGPMGLEIRMADKKLSFEKDRMKVLFLERQSKLLG